MDEKKKQSDQNAFKIIEKSLKFSFNLTKSSAMSFQLKKFAEACEFSEKIFSKIFKQLAQKNINNAVIDELEIIQITILYKNSTEFGLKFGDMVEDNLKLFGIFEYQKALDFLEIIKKRRKQISNPKSKACKITNKDLECIEYTEKVIKQTVKDSLEKNKNVQLNDNEKNLLKLLKQNKFLPNKELANKLGYNVRNIEEIRKNIRQKFNLDDFGEIKNKYFLKRVIMELAQQIEIK